MLEASPLYRDAAAAAPLRAYVPNSLNAAAFAVKAPTTLVVGARNAGARTTVEELVRLLHESGAAVTVVEAGTLSDAAGAAAGSGRSSGRGAFSDGGGAVAPAARSLAENVLRRWQAPSGHRPRTATGLRRQASSRWSLGMRGPAPAPTIASDEDDGAAGGAPAYAPASGTQHFFVLLLQRDTFLGADGLRTAKLVRAARARGMRVLLLHRVESCDFAWILETTPPDLIGAGLYQKIAIDYMACPSHAAVSAAYLAKELGAREIKTREACEIRPKIVTEIKRKIAVTKRFAPASQAAAVAAPVASLPRVGPPSGAV